jgi:hypothetical protein
MSLDELKGALVVTSAGQARIALSNGAALQVIANDLAGALGLDVNPNVRYEAVTNAALRLRAFPGATAQIFLMMAVGTHLEVLSTPAVWDGGLAWAHVRLGDGREGWCAQEYLDKVVVPPPLPSARQSIGLHFLEDAMPQAQALLATGAKLASATVVDNAGLANLLAQTVPYVIFRKWPDNEGLAIPDDATAAEAYGRQWVVQRFNADNQLGDVDLGVYVQLVNEVPWSPGHGGFWLGVLKELTAMGRKGAIGCYGVGYPEPLTAMSSAHPDYAAAMEAAMAEQVAQWTTLIPALRYAKANGHVVCLHAYCKPGTPAGQLSDPNDRQYYELRAVRLYAAVPEDAQPDLIFGECASEFSRGKFQGTNNLIGFARLFGAAVALYKFVKGLDLWTLGKAGGWEDACIDTALPALADAIKKN